jgi:hypothetical protein
MTEAERNTLEMLANEARMISVRIAAIRDHEFALRKLSEKLNDDIALYRLQLSRINEQIAKIRNPESLTPQGDFDKMRER